MLMSEKSMSDNGHYVKYRRFLCVLWECSMSKVFFHNSCMKPKEPMPVSEKILSHIRKNLSLRTGGHGASHICVARNLSMNVKKNIKGAYNQ